MPFELTGSIFDELWQESEQRGQAGWADTDTEDVDWAILPHLGRFRQSFMPIQDGLELATQEWEMLNDLWHNDPNEVEEDEGVGLAFYLSGKVTTQIHGLYGRTDDIVEPIGFYDFCSCADLKETEQWQAGEPFHRVYLGVDPLRLFGNFTPPQLDQLPRELRQILAGERIPFVHYGVITPAIYQVLQQIVYCPYADTLKHLYLQGKSLELLVLALTPFMNSASSRPDPREIESIHQARHLLLQHLDHPFSLTELAQQVNLNEFALKQGFQQRFGTTIFRYLHDHRLEVARQLLISESLSIAQVAQRVGFAHRGYFAKAFRQKFGLSPKNYRQQHQNCRL